MKLPDLTAKKPVKHDAAPDIETMHARITAREDRSAWKRLNIRIPDDELTDLQILAKRMQPKTTPENIALMLLRKFMNDQRQ